ncbi:LysM peptidoglycan-binding domain-containing protein [Mediterraneibacter catenae]|uniref:LysM peptidoglycan-binding domain-containing protein n=1 Tax=Mediterraneibacter catenae TaxID=2594882 RepID=A0A5M9I2J6_9FIRM|nr:MULTISPECIES: LysM peptidoglycan-binding domain-containing protein [Mediterraneibacter]KAA8501502.1 LysM peptidoglycan-binding domain-containing protein [Mediterraneibacter catenae]MCF2569409.1 LysM peptidoglycan-binding domain-containing protein [Mediterraneibacter glycyrrhizinilyticus]
MERQIPKNVRQIGNVSDSPKIYVEDYVDTFFAQLCEKSEKAKVPIGAFLVGDIQSGDDEEYVYIYGAIQMHDLKLSGNEYVIDDSTWKHAYEDCKQFFEDGEMLGWFVAHPGVPLSPEASTVKLHKKSFPKKNSVFIMKDPVEKDETYYVHKMNDLMEIGGHYTYYEKNPCMQNYMISSRKKNGAISSETVEDRAAQDFRDLVRKRGEHQKRRKAGGMMYVASACLVLVLIIMGVSMVNSFDRMKSVQSTLEALADTSDTVETRETSGSVTAVTSEEQAGDGQASEEDEAQSNENQSAEPQLAENQPDGSQSDDVQTASSDAESSGTSETDSAAENQSTAYTGENGSDGVYVVEEGDTLAIISRKMYGDVSHVDAICRMNGITDGNLIYVGQKLLLP